MKVSREQLKLLIKECLVELLSEGLGSVPTSHVQPRFSGGTSIDESKRVGKKKYDPLLDTPLSGGRKPSNVLKAAIEESAGGNKLMAAIFADTAVTTLSEQARHGHTEAIPEEGVGRIVQQEKFEGTPEQVFGEEAASKWANLAFATPGPNKAA